MNILFIHGNYPAQFRNLCAILCNDPNNNVVYLTAKGVEIQLIIENLKVEFYDLHRNVIGEAHHYLHTTEEAILKGQGVVRAVNNIINNGFKPEMIIFHGGMGYGLFLNEILPNSILIGYFEWWFNTVNNKYLVEKMNFDLQLKFDQRNLPIAKELSLVDRGIVPTSWQKSQFPKVFHSILEVIFDGVDTNFFKPQKNSNPKSTITIKGDICKEKILISPKDLVVTYATRGMEPLRGFPEFMQSILGLLDSFESLKVIIAGSDRIAYSYGPPDGGKSWKEYTLEKYELKNFSNRIIFTGLLSYYDYRQLLIRSDLHCYFSKPYVTSWGFFEAVACGVHILTNECKATEHIAVEESIYRVNLEDQCETINTMISILKTSKHEKRVSKLISNEFCLSECMNKWELLLNNAAKYQ